MIADTIGAMARNLLKPGEVLKPMGLTSHGVFLRLSGNWVVFVTTEPQHGPLTINVSGSLQQLKLLENVQAGMVNLEGLSFHDIDLSIETDHALFWMPPSPSYPNLSARQSRAVLEQIGRLCVNKKASAGFTDLLPCLFGDQVELGKEKEGALVRITALEKALAVGSIPAILNAVQPLIGFGAGLTPSGDDLIAGLLLALNRWRDVLAPRLELASLNQAILQLVNSRTTTLAANLIQCATQGQADERLITALDGIMTGIPDATTCALTLSQWGHSSGIDALCGMALALTPH